MFEWFRNKKRTHVRDEAISASLIKPEYTDEGVVICFGTESLKELEGRDADQYFLWQQLSQEGYAIEQSHGQWLCPWLSCYELLAQEDAELIHELILPVRSAEKFRPELVSMGGLSEESFGIHLRGWLDERGVLLAVSRRGAILRIAEQDYFLSHLQWQLVNAIQTFYGRPVERRTYKDNQLQWAVIRRLAMSAHAKMDDFLQRTVVLSPEKLQIDMRKTHIQGTLLVEVQPMFEGAPEAWLENFDDYASIPERYDINDGAGGVVQVILTDEVKAILGEIKLFPGRRISGDKAHSFLQNPYQYLGPDAEAILPASDFEASRIKAEIYFYDFSLEVQKDEEHDIQAIALILHEQSNRGAEPMIFTLMAPEQGRHLWSALMEAQTLSLPYAIYRGYEVAVPAHKYAQLDYLDQALIIWQQQYEGGHIQAEHLILDLSQYSDRVVDIGAAVAISSQYIAQNNDWFGQANDDGKDTEVLCGNDINTELVPEVATMDWDISTLSDAITQAEATNQKNITGGPGLALSLDNAKALLFNLAQNERIEEAPMNGLEIQGKVLNKKSILLISHNIENADYISERTEMLNFDEAIAARLPKGLNPHIGLKEHQLVGIAWLQYMKQHTPSVKGCVLADDMGLGKTLQLLTFVAEHLESNVKAKPVLIVAPVALLDNWSLEMSKFFTPEQFGVVLRLYGSELKDRKLSKLAIAPSLRDRGINTLLVQGWRQQASVVLTTYETLRDLSISLGHEDWGIMIFDEAQKIKNPSALVTQAAKAQKADLIIACTGTPVENSLVDLWCLFDLIQPGLLGPLAQFSKRYRQPIEERQEGHQVLSKELREVVYLQLMRRTKLQVAKDLPLKIEDINCKKIMMTLPQKLLYKQLVGDFQQGRREGSFVLQALGRARMICAHPQGLKEQLKNQDSAKYGWLLEALSVIEQKQEKVIIFTAFRSIQIFLQKVIYEQYGLTVTVINGDTPAQVGKNLSRQGLIDLFQQQQGFNVIVLSPEAVGFGVNIQAANHVIHYTRSWNPAKEDQATDRAYRIGQEKDVYVYYPTISDDQITTFEEKLDQLLSRKRSLAADILQGTGELSINELAAEVFH